MKIYNMTKPGILVLTLFLIPVLILTISVKSIKEQNKNWYNGGYDPSYAYLYNSLNMATFKLSGHVDHPGTTMQVIGGAILKCAWNIHPYGGENLKEAVIANPEYYLRILNISVAVLGALVLLIAGFFIFYISKDIWFSILIQLSPFVSGAVLFNGFTRLSQESVLMISSIVMGSIALYWYFKNLRHQSGIVHAFALISGFGLASKIIFAPLMVIPLILISGYKRKVLYVILSLLAFVVFTIPIIPMYPHMAQWFMDLFIHSGIYGTGKASIIDTENYFSALKNLLLSEPVFLTVFLLTILILTCAQIWRIFGKKENRKEIIILSALFLTQAFGYILIAKQPKVAYLLVYESLCAVNVIVIISILTKHISNSTLRNILRSLFLLLILIFIIPYGIKSRNSLYKTNKNSVNEEAWKIATQDKGISVIAVNPGPSPIAANYFGNAYSIGRYSKLLDSIYPNYYIYNTYSSNIENWKRKSVSLTDLLEKSGFIRVISYQGMVSAITDSLRKAGGNILVQPIFTGPVTVLEVSSSKDSAEMKSNITCPAEPYTFTEVLKVMPGDKFHVRVVAKGDPLKARIVASGRNSDEFYYTASTKQNNPTGWYEILMELEIRKKLSDNEVKIYCYNNGKGIVYFRDFSIEKK